MCGIAGYACQRGSRLDSAHTLLVMVRQLARRGPDDEGLALFDPETGHAAALRTAESAPGARIAPPSLDPLQSAMRLVVPTRPADGDFAFPHRFGIGHRRFSIIDPSPAGHQPFWSADGNVCVAFNGEVYNYVELRAELERAGRRFATRSDTEVLAEAFLHWGERCFERFVGFWALALYDCRTQAVLLARDRMGKAPLYLARRSGRVYWASEIDSLRAAVGWDALAVREQAVTDFVTHKLRDVNEQTFFEGIEGLPRGTWAWVDDDGSIQPQSFWSLPSRRRTEKEIAPDEAARQLRELLADSVKLRLRADVPVGVELSGGLDSSAIAATAAHAGIPVRAYTVSYPGTEWDEAHYAESVARRWQGAIEFNVIRPRHGDLFDNADDFVALLQEPFHSPNQFPNHQIWQEMAGQGLRVSMNGMGGDELFCGYPGIYLLPYLSALLERGRLVRLHREASLYVEEPAALGSTLYWSRLAKAAFHSSKRRSSWIDASGAQRRVAARAQGLLTQPREPMYERSSTIDGLIANKATDWMLAYWLRVGHQNNMGVPIEVRQPLLDHRIVEHAFSLPVTYFIRDGWLKWILRRAMVGLLPEQVLERRTKLGFPVPIAAWLVANKGRFFVAAANPSEPCPYVDLRALATSYDRMVEIDPNMLWRAMSVALWWKRCVLGEPLDASRRQHSHGADARGVLRANPIGVDARPAG